MEPSGFLPLKTEPQNGDKLILYPVYLCPVEILERGIMIRPSYYYRIVMVNAFNRSPRLLDVEEVPVMTDFDSSPFETQYLDIKVTPRQAEAIAEYGAAPDGAGNWHKIVRNRKVAVNADKMRLVWHVFAVRGDEAIDTFTGEAIPAAGLILTLFGR